MGQRHVSESESEQLALGQLDLRSARGERPGGRSPGPTASSRPVAQVVLDSPLAHLDRPFSYLVSENDDLAAQPGVRVRVRFAGRDHDGYIVSREVTSEFEGALSAVRRVVSAEQVLTPHLLRVARRVADHYAGTLSDVLRLAVPPRHASAERALAPGTEAHGEAPGVDPSPQPIASQAWAPYPAGEALLTRLAAGDGPAASWLALPSQEPEQDWPAAIAEAVAATRRSGRGSVVVVPDHRDLALVGAALDTLLGPGAHVQLTAEQGPAARYTSWLSLLRGHHDVVVGTRSAAYAPVRNPGLFVLWDELDDLHREPRSPYPHLREVLRIRAVEAGAGLLLAGFVRSVEVAHSLEQGRLRSVHAPSASVHSAMPILTVAGEAWEPSRDVAARSARLPSQAWRAVKDALARGPVLIQVPRRGYLMALSCARCRHRLHCAACQGPLQLEGPDAQPSCGWCGAPRADAPCPECGSMQRRSAVVGEARTAYEIGRAFPGVEVRSSKAGQVLADVPAEPMIVVATPGAEPRAQGGYAATVLMDGWALVDRAGLDAPLEALRRWSAAAALTRGRGAGGHVVLCGVPSHAGVRPVEALVRWGPEYLADRELTERRALGLPPLRRVVSFVGEDAALRRVAEESRAVTVTADPDADADADADARHPAVLEAVGPMPQSAGASTLLVRVRDGLEAVSAGGDAIEQTADSDQGAAEKALLDFTRGVRRRQSLNKAQALVRSTVDPVSSAL